MSDINCGWVISKYEAILTTDIYRHRKSSIPNLMKIAEKI